MIDEVITIAREAGDFLSTNLGKITEIKTKGNLPNNLVTNVDRGSEELVVARLRALYPEHRILAEEGGPKNSNSPYCWIIDPLDGTTNYAHSFPMFCVSIALEFEGVLQLGVIYDPLHDHCFSAELGKGAYLNGNKMSVSKVDRLSQSLLATGFPYDLRENPDSCIDRFLDFLPEAQGIRRLGSAALDLAYLANGWVDGFWEVNLQPWDTSAAVLMITEAGGTVSSFDGSPFNVYQPRILASNGLIHREMITVLARR